MGDTTPGCFGAGTLVATADGPRPIEDIEVGDLVWAEDERTGDVALRRVARTFVADDKDIVEVAIRDGADGAVERIEATPGHPFWTLRGWVGAGELVAGDQVLTRAQAWREVAAVRVVDGKQTVYNFEVEDDHTYFVGTGEYLVHNTPPCGRVSGVPDADFTPDPSAGPYKRPRGIGPTAAQRRSVQGKPCVDCGAVTPTQVADHIDPAVVEHYRTGAVDVAKQSSVDAVQAHCRTCSARQGGMLSGFAKRMKVILGFVK